MKYISVLCAVCGLFGLAIVGYIPVKEFQTGSKLIEVKGLSEKSVKADLGQISIVLTTEGEYVKFEELLNNHQKSKVKVMDTIKAAGVLEKEILKAESDTNSFYKYMSVHENGQSLSKDVPFVAFKLNVDITTLDIDKISKLKEAMSSLASSDKINVNCSYKYNIKDIYTLKPKMLEEATVNAQKSAQILASALGRELGDMEYIKQGQIVIEADNSGTFTGSNDGCWRENLEEKSIYKKVRVTVNAGFRKK